MKNIILKTLILACTFSSSWAQDYDVFSIGHSLVNFEMPKILSGLANSDPKVKHRHKEQINIGSPLKWNWENIGQGGVDGKVELATGNYEILVMTEAVPLMNHINWSSPWLYGGNFFNVATRANPATQAYLYETWHCKASGTPTGCSYDDHDTIPWRKRLTQDLGKWQSIVDSINLKYPDRKKMLLIPAGQALGALNDTIQAAKAPGLTSISDVYADDIHLNDMGNYFVACVWYATIYKRSPVGLTRDISNEWGTPFKTPSMALATVMQRIAWDVVQKTPGTGVSSVVTLNQNKASLLMPFQFNIQSKMLHIDSKMKGTLSFVDMKGNVLFTQEISAGQRIISLKDVAAGFYTISLLSEQGVQSGRVLVDE
jgi:hypothetical protein